MERIYCNHKGLENLENEDLASDNDTGIPSEISYLNYSFWQTLNLPIC